jgi:predicted nucleic acid-binding protein
MDLLDLPYPTTEHYKQPFGSSLDSLLYITRGFLKPRYTEPTDSETEVKKQYVDELVHQVENHEIAFRRLVISSQTLTEVVISLHRNDTEEEAEECLQEVRSSDTFKVIQTSSEHFEMAASNFEETQDKDPNFGEFIDYRVIQEEEIQYVATWDSDFTSFDQISLLPVVRWGR